MQDKFMDRVLSVTTSFSMIIVLIVLILTVFKLHFDIDINVSINTLEENSIKAKENDAGNKNKEISNGYISEFNSPYFETEEEMEEFNKRYKNFHNPPSHGAWILMETPTPTMTPSSTPTPGPHSILKGLGENENDHPTGNLMVDPLIFKIIPFEKPGESKNLGGNVK